METETHPTGGCDAEDCATLAEWEAESGETVAERVDAAREECRRGFERMNSLYLWEDGIDEAVAYFKANPEESLVSELVLSLSSTQLLTGSLNGLLGTLDVLETAYAGAPMGSRLRCLSHLARETRVRVHRMLPPGLDYQTNGLAYRIPAAT